MSQIPSNYKVCILPMMILKGQRSSNVNDINQDIDVDFQIESGYYTASELSEESDSKLDDGNARVSQDNICQNYYGKNCYKWSKTKRYVSNFGCQVEQSLVDNSVNNGDGFDVVSGVGYPILCMVNCPHKAIVILAVVCYMSPLDCDNVNSPNIFALTPYLYLLCLSGMLGILVQLSSGFHKSH
ncbi:hypothetical protein Trydic_g5895 [Trypoxylus dichotomus]